MINSKLFIVNNELNSEYITEKVKELSNNTYKLNLLNSSIDTRIDILVFSIVLIKKLKLVKNKQNHSKDKQNFSIRIRTQMINLMKY